MLKNQKGFGSIFSAVLKLLVVLWWHLETIHRSGGPFFRVCNVEGEDKTKYTWSVMDGRLLEPGNTV